MASASTASTNSTDDIDGDDGVGVGLDALVVGMVAECAGSTVAAGVAGTGGMLLANSLTNN